MDNNKAIKKEQKVFMTGNEAVAWGALAAGAEIMYGYPITPQNQIMHTWARLLPQFGRKFLQTEDEISAGFTTIGGVLTGKRAFTATAGPGHVIMQDAMSMAEMMRLPVVFIIQQRGGPSTATVIYSQSELVLTTHGGNGEGMRIVYSTSSHQELFDYTIKAFNTAWKYRYPTFVLGDGYQAEMRESLTIYDPEARGIKMVPAEPYVGADGVPGKDREPLQLRNTYNTEEELYEVMSGNIKNFKKITPEILEWQSIEAEDAEILIVAHGIISRASHGAVNNLRAKGIKAGLFRPITVQPFPDEALRKAAEGKKIVIIPESAFEQLATKVKRGMYGMNVPLDAFSMPGIGITSEEIEERVIQVHEKQMVRK